MRKFIFYMLAIWSGIVFRNFQVRVISSAKGIKCKKSEHLRKSLLEIRNNRGPSIEPWGTPRSIEQSSDVAFLTY